MHIPLSSWVRQLKKWMLTPHLLFLGFIGPGLLGLIDARFDGYFVFDGQFAHSLATILWVAGVYHGYRFGRYVGIGTLAIYGYRVSRFEHAAKMFIGGCITLSGTAIFLLSDLRISIPIMYSLGLIGSAFMYSAWYAYVRGRSRARRRIATFRNQKQ